MGLGDLNGEPMSKIADLSEENHSSDPDEDEIFFYGMLFLGLGVFIFFILVLVVVIDNCRARRALSKRVNKLTYDDSLNPTETNCPICIQDFINGEILYVLQCTHVYHKKCLSEHVISYKNKRCPVCRANIFG